MEGLSKQSLWDPKCGGCRSNLQDISKQLNREKALQSDPQASAEENGFSYHQMHP